MSTATQPTRARARTRTSQPASAPATLTRRLRLRFKNEGNASEAIQLMKWTRAGNKCKDSKEWKHRDRRRRRNRYTEEGIETRIRSNKIKIFEHHKSKARALHLNEITKETFQLRFQFQFGLVCKLALICLYYKASSDCESWHDYSFLHKSLSGCVI